MNRIVESLRGRWLISLIMRLIIGSCIIVMIGHRMELLVGGVRAHGRQVPVDSGILDNYQFLLRYKAQST